MVGAVKKTATFTTTGERRLGAMPCFPVFAALLGGSFSTVAIPGLLSRDWLTTSWGQKLSDGITLPVAR